MIGMKTLVLGTDGDVLHEEHPTNPSPDGRLLRFLHLLLLLLLLSAPAPAPMKLVLEYQDQFGKWHR